MEKMLTENEVINAVKNHLKTSGWDIQSACNTSQRGDDIVAKKDKETIFVEAKGATSSKASSPCFSNPFDSSQVRVHVAVAIHKALKRLCKGTSAIALPDDEAHNKELKDVLRPLSVLGVKIFRVTNKGEVREQSDCANSQVII